MKLIGSAASPFVQRCAIIARAKGLDIELAPIPGGMNSPEFLAMAPMGRIPLLALDDGGCICESSAIAAYLDEVLDGPSLMPAAAQERARVREIEAIACLEIAAGFRPIMIHRIFRVSENEPVVAAAFAQAEKGCGALARLISDGPYAVGTALSPADAALVPVATLASIIIDQPEIAAMLARQPVLMSYLDRAGHDPVLARTMSEMRQGFAAIRERLAQRASA
jgi:glutathione S-transferase